MRTAIKKRPVSDLSTFFTKYGAVLEAIATRVHMLAEKGITHTPSKALAKWVAHDLPSLYKAAFGKTITKRLKQWRVMTMMSNANYLGAYEALDIKSVRGRGVTPTVTLRKGKRPGLRVIEGGKKTA